MKKIFLVVCSIVISSIVVMHPLQVRAINNDNYYIAFSDGNSFMYFPQYSGDNLAYILTPRMSYEITDATMINNLAYIGTLNDDKLFQATIQMLIMRYANPSYDINLKYYNYTLVDNSKELALIDELLKEYNIENTLNNTNYEINLNDDLILNNTILDNYNLDSYKVISNDNNTIISGFNKTGVQELTFEGILNIDTESYYEPLVYATNPITNPFTIYVDVLGNSINFDINLPKYDNYHFVFEMYDLNDNYLGYYLIDKENNSIYYDLGSNIKLVDVSESIYKNNEDIIIIENDTHNYNITLNKEYKKTNFDISLVNQDIENKNIDISIYDNNFNHLKDYICISNCHLYLDKDEYIIKDNLTNTYSYYNLNVTDSTRIVGSTVKGIISNTKIDNIYINDEEIAYEYTNSLYKFKDDQSTNNYKFEINDELIEVFLDDYIYIENYGIFYNYEYVEKIIPIKEENLESLIDNKDDETLDISNENPIIEEIKDDEIKNFNNNEDINDIEYSNNNENELNNQEEDNIIVVEVPNTEINLSNNTEYLIVKKKYNHPCNSLIFFTC